ncbi:cell division protein ZapA [bacterium]|nr:cell division protein ZapA [bacterium]
MSEVEPVIETLPQKGTPKVLEINVGGAHLRLKTDATPSLLKQTKDMVQACYDEISEKAADNVTPHQRTLLVALNLAEQLIDEQEKLKALRRKVLESSDALINRVESQLSKAKL